MTTLRIALADCEPKTFALRKAITNLVRANRALKRTGVPINLVKRSAIESLLDRPLLPEAQPNKVKGLLELVWKRTITDLELQSLDILLLDCVAAIATEPLKVAITGWPEGFTPNLRTKMLRRIWEEEMLVEPIIAADIVAVVDGMVLAGSTLNVSVSLEKGSVLPKSNARSFQKRRRRKPWLRNLDEVGRFSLTPEHIGAYHGKTMDSHTVIDCFAGCGGDAISFAKAGKKVVAVELDSGRADLARLNVKESRLQKQITVIVGDSREEVAKQLKKYPNSGLFLDPPWSDIELMNDFLLVPHEVLLKVPNTFNPDLLPARPAGWTVKYMFGNDDGEDSHVVKSLAIWSR